MIKMIKLGGWLLHRMCSERSLPQPRAALKRGGPLLQSGVVLSSLLEPKPCDGHQRRLPCTHLIEQSPNMKDHGA